MGIGNALLRYSDTEIANGGHRPRTGRVQSTGEAAIPLGNNKLFYRLASNERGRHEDLGLDGSSLLNTPNHYSNSSLADSLQRLRDA